MGTWDGKRYVIKQKKLTLYKKYYIEDGHGQTLGFCKQKPFKLKEDIRVYTNENMRLELLEIKQEQVFDFSGTFRVKDTTTGAVVGYVGRKGLQSMLRDTWKMFDDRKKEIGTIQEQGGLMSILRRIFSFLAWVPKTYEFEAGGQRVATAEQKFQMFGDTWTIDIMNNSTVDTRLIVTGALMMDIIEQDRGH